MTRTLYRSLLAVADGHDLDPLAAAGRLHLDHIADARLHQRPGDGRDPAHPILLDVGLVDADDGDGLLAVVRVGIGDSRAEEHLLEMTLPVGIDHLGGFEALGQVANAAINLAKPLLAVNVIAVLRAVAVAGRPR